MNLDMVRSRNKIEIFSLSITENCETLLKETHRKAEETLKFKLTKAKETHSFKPPISIAGFRMVCLTSLEVYNSIFN